MYFLSISHDYLKKNNVNWSCILLNQNATVAVVIYVTDDRIIQMFDRNSVNAFSTMLELKFQMKKKSLII